MSKEVLRERLKRLIETEKMNLSKLSKAIGVERRSLIFCMEGKYYLRYDGLLKTADYFKVSIDYLLGLTDIESNNTREYINRTPEEAKEIFCEKIKRWKEETGISGYKLSKKLKTGQMTIKRWFEEGAMPGASELIKLSKEMNEKIDYMLGREI